MPAFITRLVLLASMLFAALPALAQDAWEQARAPGTHLLMRHALAPGTGDPANFVLGDCATQRILSETGRQQARRIGERLRANNVAVDTVLTSRWCRSVETADLLSVGPVTPEPALDSFFQNRQTAADQTAALTARLAALDSAGQKAVLVTHQVNITALTDIFPASGEIVLIRLGPDGQVRVAGRIRPE
ncbi:histidine phosphatase family protein [Aurantimonas aggregata]|uniref:Histidine phosphatase family protein n=1 Tax=Aurantimonas aggregata TaxID=2047720 RepID=A0A6L9MEZ9_9HYPH|nr:histidine phosphatase family protein [Aurantimonas aggregata]NDV86201.1 histidine phosphatase family protein [Aurantimonas aggregata]